MITKSRLAQGALLSQAAACSPSSGTRSGVARREPVTVQAYVFLLLWVTLVLSAVDGLAAVVFHVG